MGKAASGLGLEWGGGSWSGGEGRGWGGDEAGVGMGVEVGVGNCTNHRTSSESFEKNGARAKVSIQY